MCYAISLLCFTMHIDIHRYIHALHARTRSTYVQFSVRLMNIVCVFVDLFDDVFHPSAVMWLVCVAFLFNSTFHRKWLDTMCVCAFCTGALRIWVHSLLHDHHHDHCWFLLSNGIRIENHNSNRKKNMPILTAQL